MSEMLSNLPVALLSLAITGLALVFNMGFFVSVGLDFIPLFSIQEHLVFSMGGAVFLLLLFGLLFITVIATGSVSIGVGLEVTNKGSFLTAVMAWTVFGLALSVVVLLASSIEASVSLFMVICGVVAASMAFLGGFPGSREGSVILGIGFLTWASFMLGVFYGTARLDGAGNPNISFAVTSEGVRMTLVRAGFQYMRLTDDGSIVTAIEVEKVSSIYSRRFKSFIPD